jgi:hypothetical protein
MANGDTFLAELKKWQDKAKGYQQELFTRRENYSKSVEAISSGKLGWLGTLFTKYKSQQYIGTSKVPSAILPPPIVAAGIMTRTREMATGEAEPYSPLASMGKSEQDWITKQFQEKVGTLYPEAERNLAVVAETNLHQSNWYTDLYNTAPELVKLGKISSYEDWYETFGSKSEYNPTEQDIASARTAIDQMKLTYQQLPTSPSWAEGTEEEQQQIKDFLEGVRTSVPMQTINTMTVEEIGKALRIISTAEQDLGMSDTEALKIMTLMGLTEEDVQKAGTFESIIEQYSRMMQERDQQIKDVMAGVSEWETPKLSLVERLKASALSPFLALGDLMQPYIENVSTPLAGLSVNLFQNIFPGKQEFETKFDALIKSQPYSPGMVWNAARKTYNEWNMPWYGKLPIELVTDPLTYIPGWGLSKPAAIANKIGLKSISRAMIKVNEGMYHAMDIPFDFIKTAISRVPKSFNQQIVKQVDDVMSNAYVAMDLVSPGKLRHTVEDFEKAITQSIEAYTTNPQGKGALIDLGRALSQFDNLEPDQIVLWARKINPKLAKEVTDDILADQGVAKVFNDTLAQMVNKQLPEEAAAKILAGLMGVTDDTPEVISKIIKDAKAYTSKYIRKSLSAVNAAKNSSVDPLLTGLQVLKNNQTSLAKKMLQSTKGKGDFLSGVVYGLQDYTDRWTKGKFNVAMNRYLVRPMAEAYLGTAAYPIWNALEGIGISLLEGVTPGTAKIWVAKRIFEGLPVDTEIRELMEGISAKASDTAQMVGVPKSNAISFLPGKIPETIRISMTTVELHTPKWLAGKDFLEWSGKKWIALSNSWGNTIRLNFLTKKMAQHLAELLSDVNGKDVIKVVTNLTKGAPKVSNTRSLLTTDRLESEVMYALLSDPYNLTGLVALKESLSNGSMMTGEVMKILRSHTEFTPRSLALAEEQVSTGKAMTDIVSFAKNLSAESIKDLRTKPQSLVDSFEYLANQVDSTTIENSDDLMSVFQTYYSMSLNSSNLPSIMMTHTFDEASLLRKSGKWGAIDKLWRTQRDDMIRNADSVSIQLDRVKSKILANTNHLTPEQSDAMIQLIEGFENRIMLRNNTLRIDKDILDTYWSKPRAERAGEVSEAMWAERQALWSEYRKENAVFLGQDFLAGQNFQRLYSKLPQEKLTPVDASSRALAPDDIAKVFGCNVDNLTTGLMDNTALTQFKESFVQMVKQKADSRPDVFRGFTEDKISKVYDEILEAVNMNPETDIDEQKILLASESLKNELINLKQTQMLSPNDEKLLHSWIDSIGNQSKEIFTDRLPTVDIGLGEHIVEGAETKKLEEELQRLIKEGKVPEYSKLSEVPVTPNFDDINKIWNTISKASESVSIPEGVGEGLYLDNLNEAINRWFREPKDEYLQVIGEASVSSKRYLDIVHDTLRKQYPSGYIRIFRGGGMAGKRAVDREFTNITSSRRIAKAYENSWTDVAPSIDNVVIKVEDVVSICSVEESELIIPSKVLKDRIAHPISPTPTVGKQEYQAIRESANRLAHQDYYKAFADYSNQNLVDAMMRTVFPYWTYATYRWTFLPRTFIRHPGVAAAWGKYNNYSENGYVHIPGTDLDLNPFVGSAFGATFGLARHDYKSYYENLGWMGEGLDFWQRYGFYPNALYSGIAYLSPVLSGRPPELGGFIPPYARLGLDLLVASPIPGVKDAANNLKSKLFHDNFNDYYIATEVSAMQVEAGGKLIGGQSGVDLWNKLRDKVTLTEEESAVWAEATKKAAVYGALRTQFPQFRLREEEYLDAYKQVTQIFEEQLGMSEEYQDYLWKHNLRPTDVVGGLPLDLRTTLNDMWQWRIWFGRGQILAPPEISDLQGKITKYWDTVKQYQNERITNQTDIDAGFLTPTSTNHYTGAEWRDMYSVNWSKYTTQTDSLESNPEYKDAIEAMTPAGQAELARKQGFITPSSRSPEDEALDLYFSIELEKKKDPYTGEEDYDYLGFWLNREAVRNALTPEQLSDFDSYIRRYETPMETVFKDASNKYLRGYRAISRIMLESYTDEQRVLIAEYYADTTTSMRKDELRNILGPDGNKLISGWESNLTDARVRMRQASPTLDFWLYVFGYTSSPKTAAAQAMVDNWEIDKTSILYK